MKVVFSFIFHFLDWWVYSNALISPALKCECFSLALLFPLEFKTDSSLNIAHPVLFFHSACLLWLIQGPLDVRVQRKKRITSLFSSHIIPHCLSPCNTLCFSHSLSLSRRSTLRGWKRTVCASLRAPDGAPSPQGEGYWMVVARNRQETDKTCG